MVIVISSFRSFCEFVSNALSEIIKHLESIYCDSIGIEYMFIRNPEEIQWWQEKLNENDTFDQNNTLLEGTLTFNKDFGNTNLNVVGGYSYQKFDRSGIFSQGAGFSTTNLDAMANQLRDTFDAVDGAISGSYNVFGYGVAALWW